DERGSNLAADFGANGDVLKIRAVRRYTSCGAAGLIVGGMNTAGGGITELRQNVDVSGLQLRQLPEIKHEARRLVLLRQLFKHIDRGRRDFSLAVLARKRKAELAEEDLAELFRRIDVELGAGDLKNFRAQGVEFRVQPRRKLAQLPG